jgi:hypothetical protein
MVTDRVQLLRRLDELGSAQSFEHPPVYTSRRPSGIPATYPAAAARTFPQGQEGRALAAGLLEPSPNRHQSIGQGARLRPPVVRAAGTARAGSGRRPRRRDAIRPDQRSCPPGAAAPRSRAAGLRPVELPSAARRRDHRDPPRPICSGSWRRAVMSPASLTSRPPASWPDRGRGSESGFRCPACRAAIASAGLTAPHFVTPLSDQRRRRGRTG